MERCIDISKHQTAFNVAKCKSAGVTTVIGRLAYAGSKDKIATTYMQQSKSAGLRVGGYGFGTWHYKSKSNGDVNLARALMREQVQVWIAVANTVGCDSWIGIDQELERNQQMGLGISDNTQLLIEAAEMIKAAGFSPCLYASASWILTHIDMTRFPYPLWVAYYKWYGKPKSFDNAPESFPSNTGAYGRWMNQNKAQICLWQFTSEGFADTYGCTHGSNGLDKNWLYYQPNCTLEIPLQPSEPESVSQAECYPAYKGKTVSIVNALVSMGVDSSFAHRTKLAVKNGVVTTASEYKGTPVQNTALLKLLKQGKLMKA